MIRSCPNCGSARLQKTAAINRAGVLGLHCLACGEIFVDHADAKPIRHVPQKLNVGQVQGPSNISPRASRVVVTPRERYGCPHCGETKRLSLNPSLRRKRGGKTIVGHVCDSCGMAFIDHPDLRPRSLDDSRLMMADSEKTIILASPKTRMAKMISFSPAALRDELRGTGHWLCKR